MIKVKNISTGEIKNVSDICITNGVLHTYWRLSAPGSRFFESRPEVVKTSDTFRDEKHEKECAVVVLADGFELVTNEKSEPKPKKAKETEKKPQPKVEKPKAEPKAKEDAPKAETTKATDATDADAIKAELLAKYGTLGADVFEALCKVAAITPTRHAEGIDAEAVRAIFEEMAKESPAKVKAITRNASATSNDYKCSDFDEICEYVSDGQPVYLYGAAGCGKSHTAEQIAKALGLDFYTQSQILFAHDVKGYGDANGVFQETPFFKAFTRGGLFFIDEMDASAPEALVVLNTAIANRRYDFPVVGNVEAHPNFRIVAAGNTALTGADTEYTARAVQDASTINRFAFFEMQYEKNVELNVMAKGDKVLYSFICDLRKAIAEANIQLCVSYRQTAALATEKAVKYGREKALKRVVFGGRDADEIRIIYGLLKDKENVWAKSMADCF